MSTKFLLKVNMKPGNFNFEINDTDIGDDDELLAELNFLIEEDNAFKLSGISTNTNRQQSNKIEIETNLYQVPKMEDIPDEDVDLKDDPDLMDELHEICMSDESHTKFQMDVKIEKDIVQKHESIEYEDLGGAHNDAQVSYDEKKILNENTEIRIESTDLNQIESSSNLQAEVDLNLPISVKAKTIIQRRKQKYMDVVRAAKEANDKNAVADSLEKVKLFKEALEAIEEGAELTEEDIKLIPLSPPPYNTNLLEELEQRMKKFKELSDSFLVEGNQSRARSNIRMMNQYEDAISLHKKKQLFDISYLPSPPGFKPIDLEKYSKEIPTAAKSSDAVVSASSIQEAVSSRPKELPINMSIASDQLKLILSRQNALKRAALDAKQSGDLNKAKDLLNHAKSMDKMIIAAKGGLPVDVKSIPMTPTQSQLPELLIDSGNSHIDSITVKIGNELRKQIDLCQKMLAVFQERGDAKSVLLYEAFLNSSQTDYKKLQDCLVTGSPSPSYQLREVNLPILELNPDLSDDILEFKISLKSVKLPDGWKPSDASLFISYDFPFPREAHQTGQTAIVKETINPEFTKIKVSINRSTTQLSRIIKRLPLKLHIYNRGGVLIFRSDKLVGHVEVPLAKLEDSASVNETFNIMEGRKKTPGKLSIEIRVSRPLGQGKGTGTVSRKWVRLA